MFGIIGGNILKNSEEYNRAHPLVYTAEAQVIEPRVVLIGTTTKEKELDGQLKQICACESTGDKNKEPQHYDSDGSVLRGRVDNDDTGACQINLRYHKASADRMNIDLTTEEGNKKYAQHLYSEQGTNHGAHQKDAGISRENTPYYRGIFSI